MSAAAFILSPLEDVEEAVLAAMGADPTISGATRTIKSFGSSLDEAKQKIIAVPPALLVRCPGGKFRPEGSAGHVLHLEIQVWIITRNLRSEAAARRPGASGEVGSYWLMGQVYRLLTDLDLGLDGVGPVAPAELDSHQVKEDQLVSTYVLTFTAEVEGFVAQDAASLDTAAFTYDLTDQGDAGEAVLAVEVAL